MFRKISVFLREVQVELKKVSWSTREELVGSTVVVIVSVIIMAVFIGIWDLLFSKIVSVLIR
jgi:preprotein translocase subunit SecE